ncbi:MAG: rod shape-determining protein MreD [Deltaproteobacteria bacterium]|nr:rod shape-determining protein MreD [Deltaproteobacteria bacterium]MBM4324434.1 rod shape-determining protein MreD [Deltaproteobacteria bacterium]
MRRTFIPLFLGILFLILQTTLFASFPIQRVKPDLVLIFTLFLGLSFSPLSGGILVFFLGYVIDLFSGNSFGLYAFSRPLLFFSAQLFKDRIYLESYFLRSLFVFLFTLGEGIVILILIKAFHPEPLQPPYPLFFTGFLPQAFSTALLAPVLFSIFKKGYSLLYAQPGTGLGVRGKT